MAFDNGDLEVYEIFGFECKRLFIIPLLGEKKKIKFFRIYEGKDSFFFLLKFIYFIFFLQNIYKKYLKQVLGEVFLVLKDGQLVAMRKSEFSSILRNYLII